MPEVVLFKLEVTKVDSTKDESSLENVNVDSSSTLSNGLIADKVEDVFDQPLEGKSPLKDRQEERNNDAIKKDKESPAAVVASKVGAGAKSAIKVGAVGATAAGAAYSIYANYQKTGFELSGATHAAALQERKANMASTAIEIGVAVAINPLLAAPVIAMKAYQLSQTNRREIFEMKKSQLTSEILQRNLVKNVAERRF